MTESEGNSTNNRSGSGVTLQAFQKLIHQMYFEKDETRGVPATFMWLMEEVGELSSALRETDPEQAASIPAGELEKRRSNLAEEFADVLAWLSTIANLVDVDLGAAIDKKYGSGCPGCQKFVCICPDEEKP